MRREQFLPYGIAFLVTTAALLLTKLLLPLLNTLIFPLFFGAVALSAWYGGLRSGLLAIALAAVYSLYFLIEPIYSFKLININQFAQLTTFALVSLLITILCSQLQFAKHQSERRLKQLQESEARLSRLAESNLIGMVVADMNGAIIEANAAFLKMVGYTPEDLYGGRLRWNEMTPPEYREVSQRSVEEIRNTGVCTPFEKEYIRKDGSRVPVLVGSTLLQDSTVIGFVLDLTERKRSEAAPLLLAAIVESSPDAIMGITLDRKIISWNVGAEKIFGYSGAELQGHDVSLLIPPDRLAESSHIFEVLKRGESITDLETVRLRKDGSLIDVSITVSPIRNAQGVLMGISATLRDITERKRAEQMLHQRSERLKLLSEMASALLSTEQPLTLMNDLFSKLAAQMDLHFYFNFLVEQQGDRSYLRLASYGGISDAVAQTLQEIEFGQYMFGLVAQTQRQLLVSDVQQSTSPNTQAIRSMGITVYAGQPLMAQGRLLGTLSFASRTRTHLTEGEAALLQAVSDQVAVALERAELLASLQRQTEQLVQANRIKDEFLAVLSHELRTPLNPILGWAKLLRSKIHDSATVERALETIERNAQLQTDLIGDLLDVSRILQGKLSLKVEPVDLAATLSAAIETVQLAAEAKSIRLVKWVDPAAGQIVGDSGRLQQVIWNLLSNAIKFTPEGGQVSIRLEWVDTQVQIQVSDTGKGISADFLPHVFDTFRQADGATTRKFGGLGLGLSIVRHIVELHGGTVRAESLGEGQGASFTIGLPLRGDAPERVQAGATMAADLRGLKVLAVDDEADSCELVAFILEQAGAEVIQASSAKAALAALEQAQFEVLISDIGMPETDGYALMRQIRERSPQQGGKILAIALTAYAGELDNQQAIAAGFQAHLSKPIEPEQLMRAIADLLARQAALNQEMNKL